LKLNSLQIRKINEWFYDYKWSYNKSVWLLKENYYSKYELRNLIVPSEVNCRNEWVLRTGFQIRAYACFEARNAYITNINLLKSGDRKYFNLGYKRKKNLGWTINVSKENINQVNNRELGIYESTMGRIKTTENIPKIDKDCKLHFDGKHYYIIIPEEVQKRHSVPKNWFCSLDPGVRKFQTIYNPQEETVHFLGNRASTIIYKKIIKLDKLTNKKKIIKLRNQIKNLQKELHDKTSRFLCDNYSNIYIPKLNKENDIISNTNCVKRQQEIWCY
jgi:putative transposase